jgi:hypothetical protein
VNRPSHSTKKRSTLNVPHPTSDCHKSRKAPATIALPPAWKILEIERRGRNRRRNLRPI